ncbi:hypothetical protein [Deinococcus pimensis]|uniref:hypothetical protein n=1 Tax=Deinococcus pimensis TaxID=309888 RepID=UPI0012FBC728|nr:hypothetical protein [Deinococcus pimensis]
MAKYVLEVYTVGGTRFTFVNLERDAIDSARTALADVSNVKGTFTMSEGTSAELIIPWKSIDYARVRTVGDTEFNNGEMALLVDRHPYPDPQDSDDLDLEEEEIIIDPYDR